jgi:fructose-1,6-bisphosphatase/inositol monophosphatase family enzyme
MNQSLTRSVTALLETAAAEIVMPRFQTLGAGEIMEKSPGELVTIADRECEMRLSEELARLLPDARIIGEEASASDPALQDGIDEGLVWLIDPIDGTSNFAEGRSPFALMVALLDNGDRLGAWIYDPVTSRLCHAWRQEGAWINGERLTTRGSGAPAPLAALATGFMTPDKRAQTIAKAGEKLTIVPIPRCAGEQYPRVALGTNDVALFERTLPWDHAAGALFLEEAGGLVKRTDGSDYRCGDQRSGLLAAVTCEIWHTTAKILFA